MKKLINKNNNITLIIIYLKLNSKFHLRKSWRQIRKEKNLRKRNKILKKMTFKMHIKKFYFNVFKHNNNNNFSKRIYFYRDLIHD